jgi:hypothetical protein
MWLTRPSTLFRKDLAIARVIASPLVAVPHLVLAVVIAIWVNVDPTSPLSNGFWLWAALLPGLWLFICTLLYAMLLTLKWAGADIGTMVCGDVATWRSLIFRREGVAAIALLALVQAGITSHQHQPFDQDDFLSCTQGLQEPGLIRLAHSLTIPMTRQDFRSACWDAYSIPLTHEPKPATADELRKVYASK